MFDIITFYEDYNISYFLEGPNCQKGWVNIKCPHCSDKTNHLGFNLKKQYFYCWKCNGHSITYTINKLVPNENVKEIVKRYNKQISSLNKEKQIEINKKELILPPNNFNIKHKRYLKNRKFNYNYLINKYKIQGTNHLGNYSFMIIIPIFYNDQLVSYQGRDITGINKLRYKTCSKEYEVIHHKHILYNLDNCKQDYIIVCEGVFDVFRLGDNSCATFGKSYTKEQITLLKNYKKVFIFYDNDEAGIAASKKLAQDLSCFDIEIYNIIEDTDPADMEQNKADKLIKNIKNI